MSGFKSFLFSLALLSSFVGLAQERIITVAPNLSFENYEHFKRLVLDSPDSEVVFLEGFEYEWGYTYEIRVNERKLPSTLSDGTRFEYEFIEVVSKTKVIEDTRFQLFIDPDRYFEEDADEGMNQTLVHVNDSTYRYFDMVNILVSPKLKAKFDNAYIQGKARLGHFEYVSGDTIRFLGFK
ncbi:DUF4377 domain-containing protein [Sanyastnella coralliicola]|uniref:DUF4377 domain-containing protein n=1 Tax=Sanyastnella coralliicola TaxID=3069118 RepID=UPI0027B974A8|nr:DUF4377 domain-containing protein [Longitalea sp. SCSIO 12813]